MARIADVDIIMSTIAVLIVPSQQPISIGQKNLEGVLTRPLTIGQSPAGSIMVSSQRDQVEAIVAANKINVRDLSGRKEFSGSKAPAVVEFFVRLAASQLVSYGVNFLIAVACAQPDEWICDNILASRVSERTGKTLVGGAATLKVASGHKTLRIRLDPGEGNTVNVDFNASQNIQELPDQVSLRKEMQEQCDSLLEFLTKLGL